MLEILEDIEALRTTTSWTENFYYQLICQLLVDLITTIEFLYPLKTPGGIEILWSNMFKWEIEIFSRIVRLLSSRKWKVFQNYPLDIGRILNVHETFGRSLGGLIYIQFTSCVQGVASFWKDSWPENSRIFVNFLLWIWTRFLGHKPWARHRSSYAELDALFSGHRN